MSSAANGNGKGGAIRTPIVRFWRPLFCQLNYAPMWCPRVVSSYRHAGLQPAALPSELLGHMCGKSREAKLQGDPAEHDILRTLGTALSRFTLLGICLRTILANVLERHLNLRKHCDCLLIKLVRLPLRFSTSPGGRSSSGFHQFSGSCLAL